MKSKKEWYEIEDEFNTIQEMECKPSLKKLMSIHVTDANKSVIWNREQVEINNKKYHEEVERLTAEKSKLRNNLYKEIYTKIQDEVGYGINEEAAMKIWSYAYENGHAYGFSEIQCKLEETIELVRDILKTMHENI